MQNKSNLSVDQLLNKYSLLIKNIKQKGTKINTTAKDILIEARAIREKQKSNWSKDIAKLFGASLKMMKFVDQLRTLRQATDDTRSSQLISGINIIKWVSHGQHCLILSEEGDVYSWGKNGFGQLGHNNREPVTGSKPPKKIEGLPKCRNIATGYAFSMAVTTDGKLYSWGAGENGRLGTNTMEDQLKPKLIEINWKPKVISCGSTVSCAISEQGHLYSWGHYMYNGLNKAEDTMKPTILFPETLFEQVEIGPGGYHVLALTSYGDLWSWGHNDVGQLGRQANEFTKLNDDSEEYNLKPELVLFDKKIQSINCGWGHSAILTFSGDIYVCGRNHSGQLGIPLAQCDISSGGYYCLRKFTKLNHGNSYKKIILGGINSAAIDTSNHAYMWGAKSNEKCNSEEPEYLIKFLSDKMSPKHVAIHISDLNWLNI